MATRRQFLKLGAATGTGVHSSNTSIYQQASSWNDLEESMGGNLCRCATYVRIREAIKSASGQLA